MPDPRGWSLAQSRVRGLPYRFHQSGPGLSAGSTGQDQRLALHYHPSPNPGYSDLPTLRK